MINWLTDGGLFVPLQNSFCLVSLHSGQYYEPLSLLSPGSVSERAVVTTFSSHNLSISSLGKSKRDSTKGITINIDP